MRYTGYGMIVTRYGCYLDAPTPLTPTDRKRLARAGRGYVRALRGADPDVIDDDYGDDYTVWNIALDGAHAAASWPTFRAAIERHYRGDLDAAERAAFSELIGD